MEILVEPFMNASVEAFGGELVEYLMPTVNPPEQADYLFRSVEAIGELKCLENDVLNDNHRAKLARLVMDWIRRGLIEPAESITLDSHLVPEPCRREWLALLRTPIQQVIKDANRQIRSTKHVLNFPSAKGIFFLANEAVSLPPQELMNLVHRVLSCRKTDGAAMYSNIDWIVLFTVNHPAWLRDAKRRAHYWLQVHRETPNAEMEDFLRRFRHECFRNLSELNQVPLEEHLLGKSNLDAMTNFMAQQS